MAKFKKAPPPATVFKKSPLDPEQVEKAQAVAAASPLVDDPRNIPTSPAWAATSAPGQGGNAVSTGDFGARQNQTQDATYEVGQTYEIPLSAIKTNPYNPRVIYTASSVDEMSESLEKNGQKVAVTAFVESNHVILIDGEKRLRGARNAGRPTLRVEIQPRPENARALYESARTTNIHRSEQSPLDDALRWKDLLSQEIYQTQGALAQALGLSMDVVSRTLSLAQLPQRILHALAEEPDLHKLRLLNALREFWEASSAKDDEREDMTLDLINEVARKGLGYREVENRRKALYKGHVAKPRAMREPLRFGDANGEIKTFPDGRLELSLKGLNEDQAQQLRIILTKAIKETEVPT